MKGVTAHTQKKKKTRGSPHKQVWLQVLLNKEESR